MTVDLYIEMIKLLEFFSGSHHGIIHRHAHLARYPGLRSRKICQTRHGRVLVYEEVDVAVSDLAGMIHAGTPNQRTGKGIPRIPLEISW